MEESLVQQAQNYKLQYCSKHTDEILNTICIDEQCPHFFQPLCYDCAREKHDHVIQSLCKLKPCLLKIAENANENTKEEQETTDKVILNQLEKFSKEYKIIGEKLIELSNQMRLEAINLAQVQSPFFYKCKASSFLGIIFENQENILALKKSLAQLKQVLEFSGDQIKFKKPQKTQQKKNIQMQLYSHRMRQNISKFQDSISHLNGIGFDDLSYTLEKTCFKDSQYIHEWLPGIEFHADPNCEEPQVICSSQGLYKGVHGIYLKILERCKTLETFLNIGIMQENKINTHFPKDGPLGAGICIYTGTRPIQMNHIAGPEEFDTTTGDVIKAEINFKQKTFIIQNLRNGQTFQFYPKEEGFQLKEQMDKDKKVRFRISFNGYNATKIALIQSY